MATSPLIVNSNIRLMGTGSSRFEDQKRPLDYRYGPWESVDDACYWLYYPDDGEDYVFYGLTVGVKVYDQGKQIGVDEYWWQPNCVPNPDYDQGDPNSQPYIDGFVRKYPANTPYTVQKEDTGKVLGISSDDSTDYNAVWADDQSGSNWHDIEPETLEDIGTEDP